MLDERLDCLHEHRRVGHRRDVAKLRRAPRRRPPCRAIHLVVASVVVDAQHLDAVARADDEQRPARGERERARAQRQPARRWLLVVACGGQLDEVDRGRRAAGGAAMYQQLARG